MDLPDDGFWNGHGAPSGPRRPGRPGTVESAGRRQSLGLILLCATVCVPVLAAGALVVVLKLLS